MMTDKRDPLVKYGSIIDDEQLKLTATNHASLSTHSGGRIGSAGVKRPEFSQSWQRHLISLVPPITEPSSTADFLFVKWGCYLEKGC